MWSSKAGSSCPQRKITSLSTCPWDAQGGEVTGADTSAEALAPWVPPFTRAERAFPCRSPVLVCSPVFPARCSSGLFQCVFLHLVSVAFPVRNAAFSMSSGNRDAAVPAKQIHPPETSSCFPLFSQETIIYYYFCGFLPFPGN